MKGGVGVIAKYVQVNSVPPLELPCDPDTINHTSLFSLISDGRRPSLSPVRHTQSPPAPIENVFLDGLVYDSIG
uniref:Uncharacterized protein n=1 Tax=Steinernema glaseri TaxID=37863 RepID=A0A1I7YVM0_9BILA